MSLKLAMQRAARRAPRQLGESSELVRAFLRSRQNPDGGFQDRAGQSDLYYTVFGLDALDAFAETPNLATLENFLRSFGAGESLDFVHLTCLARCWHALPGKIPDATRKALLKKLRTYRAADGGFAPTSAAPHSTAYACLLGGEAQQILQSAVGGAFQPREPEPTPALAGLESPAHNSGSNRFSKAWKTLRLSFPMLGKNTGSGFPSLENPTRSQTASADLECGNQEIRKPEQSGTAVPAVKLNDSTTTNRKSSIFNRQLSRFMENFRSTDGAYSNEPGMELGSTTATAAVVSVLHEFGAPVPAEVAPWLLARCQPRGGFCATPQTPLPDLLSTAVALHALATLGAPLGEIKEPCLNFIDSLWDNTGAFRGHWADDALDVEYTFYALLALGHLA